MLPAVAAVAVLGTAVVAGVAGGFGGDGPSGGARRTSARRHVDDRAADRRDRADDRPAAQDDARPDARRGLATATTCRWCSTGSRSSASTPARSTASSAGSPGRRCGRSRSSCCRRRATQATGELTNETWQRMQDPIVVVPRRPDAPTANHTEIYLPEQVVDLLPGRQAGADHAHVERHGRGVVRGGHDQPRRARQRGRHRAAEEGRVRHLQHAGRGVRVRPPGRGHPRERPRQHVEPGVLQLRHRHPRGDQRAAAAGLARVHPHPDDAVEVLPDARHATATRCTCSTA